MNRDLNRKLEEIAFRLEVLTNDYHNMLEEIAKMDVVKESNKIIYEQHITYVDDYILNNGYTIKSKLIKPCDCLNYILRKNICKNFDFLFKYVDMDNLQEIPILPNTKRIIETYIPSQNLVLVVEL